MRDYNFLIITTSEPEYEFILQTFQNIKSLDERRSECYFKDYKILLLRSDPGIFSLGYFLTKELQGQTFNLVINAGIGGSYTNNISKGNVVRVISDCFADIGREDGTNLFEMGLMDSNEYPFLKGRITDNPGSLLRGYEKLKTAKAITVNRVTQSKESFKHLVTRYQPDIETMEGAAFFFVCAQEKLNYIQIRAVSNIVGSDDRSGWEIEEALAALAEGLKITMS